MDDRDVHDGDDADDRGASRPAFEVCREAPQQQVADVHHEHHRGRDKARIPRPPHAPRRLRPDRPCDDEQAGEEHADLRRRDRERVEPRTARPEQADRREEHDDERKVRQPRRRDVHVDDAIHVALHGIGRRPHEPHPHGEERERCGDDAKPGTKPQLRERRSGGLDHSMAAGTMVSPSTAYTNANAASSAPHESATAASPASAAALPWLAAISCGTSIGNERIGTTATRARTRSATTLFMTITGASATRPSSTTNARCPGSAISRSRRKIESAPPATPTMTMSRPSANAFPANNASRPPGRAMTASIASSSSSRSNDRCVMSIAAKRIAIQNTPLATSGSRARPGPNARLSRSTSIPVNVS